MSAPLQSKPCTCLLYPACGHVPPPVVDTRILVERDRKAAQPPPKRKPGRPKTPWVQRKLEEQQKLDEIADQIIAATENVETRSALLRQVDALLAVADFAEYCRQAWHVVEPSTELEWNWHHELICKIIQGVFEDWMRGQDDKKFVQKIRNIVFNVPPGSLKSRILCVFFPSWAWIHRPGWKVICLSVNEEVALRDARDTRNLIRSDWYQTMFQPDWSIKEDQDAIKNYGNTRGGIRLSRAQASEIVGLRGDFILIDDPNNPKEAESAAVRNEVNEIWKNNIFNRVNDPVRSVRIGIQQRTHAMDWTGYVTKNDGVWTPEDPNPNKWLHVVIPAEFEPDRRCVTPWGSDPRTEPGESLHPVRMTREFLAAERVRFGSQAYAGQMQQRPVLAEGGRVKVGWLNWCRLAEGVFPLVDAHKHNNNRPRPDGHNGSEAYLIPGRHGYRTEFDLDWVVISVDPAAKKTERGSNYGILVIGGKGMRRFVLDDRSRRGEITDILKVLKEMIAIWRPDKILIEAKAAGPSLLSMFTQELQNGDIRDANGKSIVVVVEPVEPGAADKETRFDACIPQIEAGLLYVLDGAPWVAEFVDELTSFPLGAHDDRVDALSQCLNHMSAWSSYSLPQW